MLPEVIYDEYSRRLVPSNQQQSTYLPDNLSCLFSPQSVAPYIILLPYDFLNQLSMEQIDNMSEDFDEELALLENLVTSFIKPIVSVLSTLHIALFAIATICFGILSASAITVLVVAYQAFQVSRTQNDMTVTSEKYEETTSSHFQTPDAKKQLLHKHDPKDSMIYEGPMNKNSVYCS